LPWGDAPHGARILRENGGPIRVPHDPRQGRLGKRPPGTVSLHKHPPVWIGATIKHLHFLIFLDFLGCPFLGFFGFWGSIGSLQVEKRTYGLRQGSGRHSERTIRRTDRPAAVTAM